MKTIMCLFSFVMLTSMTFKNNVSPGDPMAGVEVKLWNTSKGIIATGVTDKNGMVEFKNLSPLAVGQSYEVEFGIREKGIKASELSKVKVNEADLASRRTANSTPKVITQKVGDIEMTVTVTGNSIRGSINVSRSNIKQ